MTNLTRLIEQAKGEPSLRELYVNEVWRTHQFSTDPDATKWEEEALQARLTGLQDLRKSYYPLELSLFFRHVLRTVQEHPQIHKITIEWCNERDGSFYWVTPQDTQDEFLDFPSDPKKESLHDIAFYNEEALRAAGIKCATITFNPLTITQYRSAFTDEKEDITAKVLKGVPGFDYEDRTRFG